MQLKTTLILLLLITGNLSAQEAVVKLSLQQAVDYAAQNQVNVKNALLEEQNSKQKVNELVGIGTPQITGSAEINDFIELPTSFIPAEFFGGEPGSFAAIKFGQQYTSSVGVSASQLVFDGSYLVGLQASRTYQELSRRQVKQTKIETNVAVTKAYYNVLVNNERLVLINANVERLKKSKDEIKAYYDAGFAEKLDYDRIELAYNTIVVQKQNIERFVQLGYSLLKFQMGMPQKTAIELTDKLDENKWSDMSLPDQADATKRIEYNVLQTTLQLQKLDLKRYRSAYLPSLVAFGSVSANASRDEFNIFDPAYRWYPTAIIGAKLSVPIWDGLQKRSKIQQSKIAVQKVDNAIANLQEGINLEYSSAKINLQNNLSLLQTSKRNREIATEIVRATKIKYDNGVGSSLDVIEAESALKEADTNYFNALYDTIISKVDADKALGNIQ